MYSSILKFQGSSLVFIGLLVCTSLQASAETQFFKINGRVSDQEMRAFEELNDQFNQYMMKKDIKGLMSLYDAELIWLPPNTPRSMGSKNAEINYQRVMSQPKTNLSHTTDIVHLSKDGSLAAVIGTYRYESKDAHPMQDTGKFQMVVASSNGKLKIKSDIFNSDQMTPTSESDKTNQKRLEVAKRFIDDGIGKANMKAFDETLSTDVIVRTGLSPSGPIIGIKAYKDVFKGFADAFPVVKFEVPEMFVSEKGNQVVVRFIATAVFLKDYYGVKATNEVISMEEVHILNFTGDRITQNIVSGTNLPFEYIMYPALKEAIIGNLPKATAEQLKIAKAGGIR